MLLRNREATGRYFNVAVAGAATIEADGDRGFAGSLTGNPERTTAPVDDPGLRDGSWSVERAGGRQHRWTDGDALLPPMPGATAVEIRLAGAAAYPAG